MINGAHVVLYTSNPEADRGLLSRHPQVSVCRRWPRLAHFRSAHGRDGFSRLKRVKCGAGALDYPGAQMPSKRNRTRPRATNSISCATTSPQPCATSKQKRFRSQK